MMAVDDPDSDPSDPNPDRLVFARGNLAAGSVGVRYGIVGESVELDDGEIREHPRVVWRGESLASLEEAFASSDGGPIVRDDDEDAATVADQLRDYLDAAQVLDATGELVALRSAAAKEIEEWGREFLNVTPRTLRRARKTIGATTTKLGGNFGGDPGWWWSRSVDDAKALKIAHDKPGDFTEGDTNV